MKTRLTSLFVAAAAFLTSLPASAESPQRIIVHQEECNDADWHEWQSWTTGTILYVEGFYGGMGYSHPIDVEKRVSRDADNPAWQMRILNYHRNEPREGDIDELIVQYDPRTKKLFIPSQDFGMRTAVEDKEGVKGIPGYIAGYETFYPDRESPYASFDEEDGTMTLHTLVYWDGILLDDGTRGKYVYTESIDEVKLDGFTDYDVHILSDECVFSTTHKVRLDITEDPHDVCYELVHGLATTEKIEEIANNKVNPLTESREVEFTLREGLNTIVAISYDKQQKRYINVKEIYCMPEDAQNWRAIGTGKFTEDAISGLGAGMGVPTYDVAVEENVNTPGYYRIVNAYADYVKDYQGLACHDGHNHYLYIDASVPTQVMLAQQHTGVKDEKLGNIYITSKAYEDMMAGKMRVEYAKHLGTLENGIISFPKESVGVKLPEYQQDYIWWVNTSKCFGLTLPVSGIKDIEYGQQDGSSEYFTLQGIRIENPAPGTICIVKRGTKTAKIRL